MKRLSWSRNRKDPNQVNTRSEVLKYGGEVIGGVKKRYRSDPQRFYGWVWWVNGTDGIRSKSVNCDTSRECAKADCLDYVRSELARAKESIR